MVSKKYLLIEPDFPIPKKSKNHKNFLPIGLLKLASYLRENNNEIKLIRGIPDETSKLKEVIEFKADEIWITSLFTYWSKFVKDTINYFRKYYPRTKITVGGIYASLMPEHCKQYSGCDEVFKGVHKEAEKYFPAYDLVKVNYQIIHASRGCIRKCNFCGVYKIEPKYSQKKSIVEEIRSNKLIFYDNNFLANKNIRNILKELEETKYNERVIYSECQSGLDGRLLTSEIATSLKKARFLNPRIAWDNSFDDYKDIQKQIKTLEFAGYKAKDIYIFMVYNYNLPFNIMEKKRIKCKEWGVQIADCRYRPLNQTYDNYNPYSIHQNSNDYYIHKKWTDSEIKKFRKNVREQNICVRHGFKEYKRELEKR